MTLQSQMIDYIVSDTGYLREYVDFASEITDAPLIYHLGVGLVTVAVAVGNQAFLPHGAVRLFPNLWVVLLGPTSFFRKTSSMQIGRAIIERFEDRSVLPDEFSPERLYERLAQRPEGLISWSEMGSALSNFERSYMIGVKEFLADLYDCRPRYLRETKAGVYKIENPAVSILTCSTPEWLQSRLKEADIRGGFFPRFIFLPAMRKEKTLPIPPAADEAVKNRLVERLNLIKKAAGPMALSADAVERYREHYVALETGWQEQSDGDLLSGFYTRLSIYSLKFAMLLTLSDGEGSEISAGMMARATMLTNLLIKLLKEALSDDLATGVMARKSRIAKIIRKSREIPYRDLLQASHMLANELRPILETLEQEGRIRWGRTDSGKGKVAIWNDGLEC